MKLHFRSGIIPLLLLAMVASPGDCSNSSTPTEADGIGSQRGIDSPSTPTEAEGISAVKGIDGAYEESGSEGTHPEDWEDD